MGTDKTDAASADIVRQFCLPDVGEGLSEAEIIAWHVAVGDRVEVDQAIVEIETAKSMVELPSPYAGTVVQLLAAAGDVITVGTAIISIATAASDLASQDEPKLLVGYGPGEDIGPRRRRSPRPSPLATDSDAAHDRRAGEVKPRAKPPVRKLANVLGIDLAAVFPSGADGIISRADVLSAHRDMTTDTTQIAHDAIAPQRIAVKGVRKHMAAAMVASALTAPHVTEFVTVDVTPLINLKGRLQRHRDFKDTKLTALALVARAYLLAVARNPIANGRWEEAAQEIVIPASVNLGIAAATPRGLVVPNIRAAERYNLRDLADAINMLARIAREGKTSPEAMTGGTTTITNVGVFGVDTGTPILNPGETAILAVGAIRRMPWVVDDTDGERIVARSVIQLALSFDHRVMDGQQGSQLLADTAAILAEPGLGLL